ncbi:MAG TPA: Stk1 family PASTA domain-containing Ser/Thr kinase [Pseudonocardiaceae bacterium]
MTRPRLLSDRYELGETLGYGGMSEVHKGRDVRLGRDVAIKVLRADLARDPQFQLRFRREAQNSASLNHPAIVAVYDTGETRTEYGPLPYIVMEFVDGRTLRDIVKTEGPVAPRRAMEIMADATAALDFSHRNGIIHRDVKPANIMITRTGAVKVMDFGIARALADGQNMTQTAAVIGTAQYLSPEQARGEPVDARSDVYAAGCVLFELLTGEPPFTGDSPVAVAYQHVREDPRAPSAVNPRIDPVLDAVVLKAMSKNPANRYQSAADMRADLVRVLSGQRPSAPQVMTDDERTTILGATGPTMVAAGRHRPEALLDDDYDDEDRGTRKGVIAAIALLVVGLLVLGGLLIANVFGDDPPAAQVAVPSVVGMQRVVAEGKIAEVGLKARVQEVETNDPNQVGNVISTDPEANTQVAEGAEVVLNVGKAPAAVPVPDTVGKSLDEASALLQQAGFTVGATEQQEVDDEEQVGKVVGQDPPAGTPTAPNTPIKLIIGAAREQVNVIDVVGQNRNTAKSNLEGIGLVVNVVEVDSVEAKDTVVSQDPKGGTKLNVGGTVTINVSKGNQIKMPDLNGMTQEQAQRELERLGWTGLFEVAPVNTTRPGEVDKILEQDPAPDQPLSKDQKVRIQVGRLGVGPGPTTTG